MLKISHIPRHQRQSVTMSGGGELAVDSGDTQAGLGPAGHQLAPDVGGREIEAEHPAFHAIAQSGQPLLEIGLSGSMGQALDAVAELSYGDRAHVQVRLVVANPCQNGRIGLWSGHFAQNVGIDEEAHRETGRTGSLERGGTSKE